MRRATCIRASIALFAVITGCASPPPERMTGEQLSVYPPLTQEQFDKVVKVGTTVRFRTAATGSIRSWRNDGDGKFVASFTSPTFEGGRPQPWVFGHGKWWTNHNQYCVSIEWRSKDDNAMNVENWCRALYLVNGTYYLAPVELKTARQRQAIWGTAQFSN
ncbi:hypothetical protein [Variovorax sp. J31P207]|uniref:hypothetical protein n=1 Tax=Variovorax sp. J31P207 TaxID=3053510 RepID=UPI002578D304|nr:hypothetical protein [Variovorax sp. J31P207]MDM0070673.1 hypothetical protein [Variovorax sp. J31P207]